MEKQPWGTRDESYKEALNYLAGRLKGNITSLITPWPKMNKVGVNGWEWNSAVGIFSRPGEGKTTLGDQLAREVHALNPGQKMRILKFELEMLPKVTAIREFSSYLGKSYAYMCSAETDDRMKSIEMEDLERCWNYVQNKKAAEDHGVPENIVELAPTVDEFEQIIHDYMNAHKLIETAGGFRYVNTLVIIDHIRLLRKDGFANERDMIYEACLRINKLKKMYPLLFVVLGHLNRDIDNSDRCEQGTYGNYIRDSDVFGSDAAFQNFDIIAGFRRPALKQIKYYGPQNYIIDDEFVIAVHFLKVRNGIPGLAFFRGEFDKMQIIEMSTPPRAMPRGKKKDEEETREGTQLKAL